MDNEHHILKVQEEAFPEKYRPIIRKLQKAVEDTEIKKKMELEDGIIDELEDMERVIEDLEQRVEETSQEKEQMRQENEQLKSELENLRKLLNGGK